MPEISLDTDLVIRYATNATWALAVLFFGWVLAGWAERAINGSLRRVRPVDDMLRGFLSHAARWGVIVIAAVAALDRLGVHTTSVIAVLGAAGLAVALALQGTLSHLAAGVMLLVFRPFKVGDAIETGAHAGKVLSVTLFSTRLATPDNVEILVPNAMIWNAAIRNTSVYSERRIEILLPVAHGTDGKAEIERIRAIVTADPRVLASPAPSITVARIGEKSAEISVQPWCASGDAGALKADLSARLWSEVVRPSA